jgi:hypothetical protein
MEESRQGGWELSGALLSRGNDSVNLSATALRQGERLDGVVANGLQMSVHCAGVTARLSREAHGDGCRLAVRAYEYDFHLTYRSLALVGSSRAVVLCERRNRLLRLRRI